MKKSQEQWIKEKLERDGKITRNEALSRFCSRLGARIADLKAEGWEFITYTLDTQKPDGSKGKDYVYEVKSKPEPRPLVLNFN
jgi:DNA polymerase III delta subunit